jgi:hypothetical protein
MAQAEVEKKSRRTAKIIVLVVFLGAIAWGILSTNLSLSQSLFPVAGQVVNQYQMTTTPSLPTTSVATPEFGSGIVATVTASISLLLALIVIRRMPQRN